MPECFIVVAKGAESSSTAEAYSAIDGSRFEPRENTVAEQLRKGDLAGVCRGAFNRFEKTAVFDPAIKAAMLGKGALTAMLSGSGSAVFGVFEDETAAGAVCADLLEDGYFARLCRPAGEV